MNGIKSRIDAGNGKEKGGISKKLRLISGLSNDKIAALKIICIYVLVSFLWILFSDKMLSLLIKDLEAVTRYQMIKGGFFIMITAFLMYHLIDKNTARIKSKMMEENQALLNKTLEHERLQTEFFSSISHEFKTPLNVILGTVQLLEHYVDNAINELETKKLYKCIGTMKKNCYRLLKLINNLIDITKLDFDSFNIKYKNYDIIYILEEIIQSTVVLAEGKGIRITFDTDVEEKIIACDINILERIMFNLISNAIKYSEMGDEINVVVCEQQKSLLISVKDTGVGIPEGQLSVIFDRFMQVDDSLLKKAEGSGIGLSLVKNLVEKINGEISVKSQVGVGSEFIIRLPVEVLMEESIELNRYDYGKTLIEKTNIEFSDIYY